MFVQKKSFVIFVDTKSRLLYLENKYLIMIDLQKVLNDEYSEKELASYLLNKGFSRIIFSYAKGLDLLVMITLSNRIFKINPPDFSRGDVIKGFDGYSWLVSDADIRDIKMIFEGNPDLWEYFCQREINGGFFLDTKKKSEIKEKIGHVEH